MASSAWLTTSVPVLLFRDMDGLSAAASVVALIQISGQIFTLCQDYFSSVKNAREDIRRLRDEVMFLQDAVDNEGKTPQDLAIEAEQMPSFKQITFLGAAKHRPKTT